MKEKMRKITGSVQPRSGRYYVILNLYVEGKRKQKWIPTEYPLTGDKEEAEVFLRQMLSNINSKRIFPLNYMSADMLFTEYLYSWLATKKSVVAEQTYDGYHCAVHSTLTRFFAPKTLTLQQLSPADIYGFYQEQYNFGHKSVTVLHHHRLLKQALSYAVKTDLLQTNVMDKIDAPKDSNYKATVYTRVEAKELLQKIDGDLLYMPVLLSLYYGLRRSEVLGLRWESVDFELDRITIENKVLLHQRDGESVTFSSNQMKTEASRRTLPLVPFVKTQLKEEWKKQVGDQYEAGSDYQNHEGFVCVDSKGRLISPAVLTKRFPRLIDRLGLKKIRFHDLRHTNASLLAVYDVSIQKIQSWLGHSDYRVTAKYYAHLDSSENIQSAKIIDSILSPQHGSTPPMLIDAI